MSQTRRSRVRAVQKHRLQVASFIAGCQYTQWSELVDRELSAEGFSGFDAARRGITDGQYGFIVPLVRRAAEAQLREALEVDQVFRDWTRSLGLGPENREPGAFDGHLDAMPPCEVCDGAGQWEDDSEAGECIDCEGTGRARGGYPGNLARRPDNPCPSWAPMARARARIARRVLDAIAHLPDECESCIGPSFDDAVIAIARIRRSGDRTRLCMSHETRVKFDNTRKTDEVSEMDVIARMIDGLNLLVGVCPACEGSRRNVASLPPIEWSSAVRRRAMDWYGTDPSGHGSPEHRVATLKPSQPMKTRVGRRGDHRPSGHASPAWHLWQNAEPGSLERADNLDWLIHERGWDVCDDDRPYPAEPRWYRGEMATIERRQGEP